MYELELRPVTTNTYYRNFNSKTIISAKGREFKESVQWMLRGLRTQKVTGPVEVFLLVFYQSRAQDIDNCQKSILDSCKEILFEDDKMVKRITVEKIEYADIDKFIIEVKPYEIPVHFREMYERNMMKKAKKIRKK